MGFDREDCWLLCRKRPAAVPLVVLSFALCMPVLLALILALANASVTIPPQYAVTLVSNANFTYNVTADASAQFGLWSYTETRHYTNTSTAQPDPAQASSNPYTSYAFISTFQTGCSYYGYPLVLGVAKGSYYAREPVGANSLRLTSPGCAAMIASRAFGVAAIPLLLVSSLFILLLTMDAAQLALKLEGSARLDADNHLPTLFIRKVALILLGVLTAVFGSLLLCVLLWATAAGFSSAGAQWDAYVYVYVAAIVYVLVVAWAAAGYDKCVRAEAARRRARQTDESGVPGTGNPWEARSTEEPHTEPSKFDCGTLLFRPTSSQ